MFTLGTRVSPKTKTKIISLTSIWRRRKPECPEKSTFDKRTDIEGFELMRQGSLFAIDR